MSPRLARHAKLRCDAFRSTSSRASPQCLFSVADLYTFVHDIYVVQFYGKQNTVDGANGFALCYRQRARNDCSTRLIIPKRRECIRNAIKDSRVSRLVGDLWPANCCEHNQQLIGCVCVESARAWYCCQYVGTNTHQHTHTHERRGRCRTPPSLSGARRARYRNACRR